jgi:arsenate reductase
MRKIYHLATCKTCQRIIEELDGLKDFEHQNIKEKNIEPKVLDWAAKKAGSYEALFSRRAMKFRSMGLKDKKLAEKDYRKLILEEYTFLKRPLIIVDDQVFAGSARKVVEGVREAI